MSSQHVESPRSVRDPVGLGSLDPGLDGPAVSVVATFERPRLALLDGVVSDAECDALIGEAITAMDRSEVIGADNIASTSHESRTSSGMYFEPGRSPLADALQRRLMSLVGLPVSHGEPLQVLRYGPGQVYEPHFDFFEPDAVDSAGSTLSQFGQRVATVICYLADVRAGGATVFPEIGLEVRPRRGSALYFTYLDADGSLDRRSLHAGAPVVEGEKWIVTQWCRERPYRLTTTDR